MQTSKLCVVVGASGGGFGDERVDGAGDHGDDAEYQHLGVCANACVCVCVCVCVVVVVVVVVVAVCVCVWWWWWWWWWWWCVPGKPCPACVSVLRACAGSKTLPPLARQNAGTRRRGGGREAGPTRHSTCPRPRSLTWARETVCMYENDVGNRDLPRHPSKILRHPQNPPPLPRSRCYREEIR